MHRSGFEQQPDSKERLPRVSLSSSFKLALSGTPLLNLVRDTPIVQVTEVERLPSHSVSGLPLPVNFDTGIRRPR